MRQMPTIHDVARKAKVSIAAVSLVMNNPKTPRVGATKRQIIMDVAKELGYSASGIAKALIDGETKIIGLVVPMRDPIFFNHFIAQFLSGIQVVLLKHGYHLMIYSHQASTGEITMGEIAHSRFTDGLIVLNTRMCTAVDQKSTIDSLMAARIPFVMANCYSGNDPINYVGLDDYGAGELGGSFLTSHGHRHVAFISGAEKSPMSTRLLDGFKHALRMNGLKFSSKWHVYSEYEPARVTAAVQKWLSAKIRPTAIFCGDDQFVPEVYRAIKEAGFRIPEDIAVLGRGDTTVSAAVVPQLSTITISGFRLGNEAAEMLINVLSGRSKGPKRLILPCTLTPGSSV
jgi:LacI family transcriptional regulator